MRINVHGRLLRKEVRDWGSDFGTGESQAGLATGHRIDCQHSVGSKFETDPLALLQARAFSDNSLASVAKLHNHFEGGRLNSANG